MLHLKNKIKNGAPWTHEMVEEETVVERETRIIECERLALVRSSGDDDLSDAHIFEVGTYPTRHSSISIYMYMAHGAQ